MWGVAVPPSQAQDVSEIALRLHHGPLQSLLAAIMLLEAQPTGDLEPIAASLRRCRSDLDEIIETVAESSR